VVGAYASGQVLMSGWLARRQRHRRARGVLEARIDAGRVVLIGFRPQHRGQSHGTFKLLFNALLLAGTEPPSLRSLGSEPRVASR